MQQSNANLETSNSQQNAPDASANGAKPSRNAAKAQEAPANPPEEPKKLSLAELFSEDDSGDEQEPETDDPTKPLDSIESLKKRMKLSDEQVYAIKIPMPNGAPPVTLGELKDKAALVVDLDSRELQFDQRRTKQEGELLNAQREMREVLELLPREHLTPALIKKVRTNHEAHINREQELTLEHIPEWNDENTMTADIRGMNAFLGEYGFTPNFLRTIVDHRAMKFIRDMWKRDERIKKALAEVKTPPKKAGVRPSGKPTKPAARPADAPRVQKVQTGSAKLRDIFR